MGRLSRGCLRCRQRRVRCDEGRPSCQRCIHRSEVCEGYRDESSLIFRHETDKVIEHSGAMQAPSLPSSQRSLLSSTRNRSASAGVSPTTRRSSSVSGCTLDPSIPALEGNSALRLNNHQPWLKRLPVESQKPLEEQAVDQFMDRYVLYACNQTSSPGFLEHLPCMFKEVNIGGRYALRWAVQAAAYADVAKDQGDNALACKALHCYGMALGALGESLSTPGKVPDDYDLMTVVMLDVFEVGFTIRDTLQIIPLTDGFRHYMPPTKSEEDHMFKEWHKFSGCGEATWSIARAAGVYFDLHITGL